MDDLDAEALRAAAGFDTPPVDLTGTDLTLHSFDASELQRQLQAIVDLRDTAVGPEEGTDGATVPDGLDAEFCESDLRREYGGRTRCDTLVISFGGLVQGMGGVALHEFVGVAARAGACTLFVRDAHQAWYLRSSSCSHVDGGGEGVKRWPGEPLQSAQGRLEQRLVLEEGLERVHAL